MAASDVAFLASELVSEAEGPVSVPVPAEGRLGYRFVKRVFDIALAVRDSRAAGPLDRPLRRHPP